MKPTDLENENALRAELDEKIKWALELADALESHKETSDKLRDELLDRTKWAERLKVDLDEKAKLLIENVKQIKDLEEKFDENVKQIEELENQFSEMKRMTDREIMSLKRRLKHKNNEIIVLERSCSYRVGRIFVYPVHLVVRCFKYLGFGILVFLNLFRHPVNFMRKFNIRDIGRFFKALKDENSKLVMRNVRKFFSKKGFGPVLVCKKYENYFKKNLSGKLVFEKFENPKVSIVIPVYNQWKHTYACLYSILQNVKGIKYEIIIGDDVSTDETKNITKYIENIIINRNKKNLGFLRNCNNAASKAKGEFIVFLNNDTNVQEGWLESLLEVFDKDEEAGLVGSKLIYPDGRMQEAGGIVWSDGNGWNYGRFQYPELPEFNYLKEVDYISGASIMVKTFLWKEIGGFDERYERAYCEDLDFAFEVRKHGFKVIYQPKSVLLHFEGISCGTDEGQGEKAYQVKNNKMFREKWVEVLESEQVPHREDFFHARDRSIEKETILFIDDSVPAYDKNAGGRMVYQYLKELVGMGYNVKFLPSNFNRKEPYVLDLQQMGIEVFYGPWYRDNWDEYLKENGKYFDYVFLNRAHISVHHIDALKKFTDAKIIYNPADFSYLRIERAYEVTGNKKFLDDAREHKKIEFDLFSKSEVVVTVSEYERDLLKQEMPDKSVYVVPVYFYEDKFLDNLKEVSFEDRNGLLFVGGFNHMPNVDGVEWFVSEIMPKLLEKDPTLIFNIVGSNPTEEVLALNSDNVKVLGYVSDEELCALYSKNRVVVAPLRFGAGVKGKIIEAMAHGVPVVTTNVGAEGIVGLTDDSLFIADEAEDYVKAVEKVYLDKEVFEKAKNSSLNLVKDFYSTEKARGIFKELFSKEIS